jgi:hypothetical protein
LRPEPNWTTAPPALPSSQVRSIVRPRTVVPSSDPTVVPTLTPPESETPLVPLVSMSQSKIARPRPPSNVTPQPVLFVISHWDRVFRFG